MRQKIGEHWYELPTSARTPIAPAADVLGRSLDLLKLYSEEEATPIRSYYERRPCRGCGRQTEVRYLEIVETSAGWRMLCATCRSGENSDPSNRL